MESTCMAAGECEHPKLRLLENNTLVQVRLAWVQRQSCEER